MAELLNDSFGQATSTNHSVTVEMMDYEYVRNCKDSKILRSILDELQSGREGYYPDVCFYFVAFMSCD